MPEIIVNLERWEVDELEKKARVLSKGLDRPMTKKQVLLNIIESGIRAPIKEQDDEMVIDTEATKENLREVLNGK